MKVALGLDDGGEFIDGAGKDIIDEDVLIFAVVLDLLAGLGKAALDDDFVDFALGAAAVGEAHPEDFRRGREDEDGDSIGHPCADLFGALDVYIEEKVAAMSERFTQGGTWGAIVVAKDIAVTEAAE